MNVESDPIYSAKFCANFRAYQKKMLNPSQVIEVVAECGDTCSYCPSWHEKDGKCVLYDYQFGANRIDRDMLQALNLKPGDRITSGELRERVKNKFGTNLPSMCSSACGFEGVLKCAQGLRTLQQL
jgi:hypothetical protein